MNPSELIDQQIADLPGWRGQMLARLRQLINATDPNLTEGWKWGTAVWDYNGLVCAISAFKDHVKINFFKGVGYALESIGAPAEIIEPARLGMFVGLPWTFAVAYRRFHQGVMIRFEHSSAVTVGTLLRFTADAVILVLAYQLKTIPGTILWPESGCPKLRTMGSSCIARPMP